MNKEIIAKRLINLRGERTQLEVAKALGISQSTYAMYETGRRIPTDEIKIKIICVLRHLGTGYFF